ncbi:tetratricopeptide repeat protein [Streptomyces lasiicapitis]|uniref:tetratricopeptide repeat protein n=1 Tax=Streptomyces lasiicapitis TaxID=1923961 RepID=UPI00367A0AC0
MGKTELALQAARAALERRWAPGGVLFVDLHGYDESRRMEPSQALDSMLRSLGIPGEYIPPDEQGRARLYATVLAAFAKKNRRLLVVVDNASSADQAGPLLPTDGVTPVVVTSRHRLAQLDARLLDVKELALEASVELLRRALKVGLGEGDTRVHDHPEDARIIARLCGNLPLALAIIAARLVEVPSRPLDGMAGELARTDALLDEMRSETRAVRTAFNLSYRLLSADEARLFRLLVLNPGYEISTEATAALAGSPIAALRATLDALHRAHLIECADPDSRWRMHDLVRLYAEELSDLHAVEDDARAALDRLLSHYLVTAEEACAHVHLRADAPGTIHFASREQALTWFDAEYVNLTSAVITADAAGHHAAVWLPVALTRYLNERGYFDDWVVVTRIAAAAASDQHDRQGEAAALDSLATALIRKRRFGEALEITQRALRAARKARDKRIKAQIYENLGFVMLHKGRIEEATRAHRRAASLYRKLGDVNAQAMALGNVGLAMQKVGRINEALAMHQKASALRTPGQRIGADVTALNNTGLAFMQAERFPEAIRRFRQAVELARRYGDDEGEAQALHNLGLALVRSQRCGEAIDVSRQAVEGYRRQVRLNSDTFGLSLAATLIVFAYARYAERIELREALEAARESMALLDAMAGDPLQHAAATSIEAKIRSILSPSRG